MRYRIGIVAIIFVTASWTLHGQTAPAPSKPAKSGKAYAPPKTPWGDPDLQGNWPAQFNIPMQRAGGLKDKDVLSDEEFAQTETQAAKQSADVKNHYPKPITINPP